MPFRVVYIIDNDRPLVRKIYRERGRCKVGVVLVNELYDGFMGQGGCEHLRVFSTLNASEWFFKTGIFVLTILFL